jgi:hypothetical protein
MVIGVRCVPVSQRRSDSPLATGTGTGTATGSVERGSSITRRVTPRT